MKHNYFTLVLAILISMVSSAISAADFQAGGIYYRITSSSAPLTVSVTYRGSSYTEYSNEYTGSVTIPETVTYNGKIYNVTGIAYDTFRECTDLSSVIIPESVTYIGNNAFRGCSSLTSVSIPNSITSIGEWAFYGCSGLTKAEFANVESLFGISFSEYANPLYYAHHLYINGEEVTDLVIPNSVTSIGRSAFSGCSGLTSVTIGNSVTSIGRSAFSGCSGLTSVTIGNSVTEIGEYAFCGCSGLTSVTLPQSVTYIGPSAFSGCSCLTSITIPNSVTNIEKKVFYECSSLTSITIPNRVTGIESQAFERCKSLTSVIILGSVSYISSDAFKYCTGLTKAEFASVGSLCGISFWDSSSNPLSYAHHLYINGEEVTDIVIPNGLKSINNYTFLGCSGLTSVTIPSSVTSIGSEAFSGCTSLTSVTINSNTIASKSSDYSSALAKIFGYQVTNYVFGDNVQKIGHSACYGCSGLTSITISHSVTSIGSNAFSYCSGLTSVTIDNNTIASKSYSSSSTLAGIFGSQVKNYIFGDNVQSIGAYACYKCSDLTYINIGNNVKSIGSDAFYGCSGLENILVGSENSNYDSRDNSNAVIETKTNKLITGCKNTIIPNSVTSIGSSAFYGCSDLTSVTIPNGVTSIGDKAFYNCSGLTSVTINSNTIASKTYTSSSTLAGIFGAQVKNYVFGDNVQSIGAYACYNCKSLSSVTIPNSMTSIGNSAFYGCSGLTSIAIPNNVASINNYTFYGCTSLNSITIPENVTSIGDYAFRGCSGLTSIEIPNKMSSIGNLAFYGCSGLTSLTIPNSVTSIGSDAFAGCTNLTSVYINSNAVASKSYSSSSSFAKIFGSQVKNYFFGDNITSIGAYACYNCKSLTSVTIPNSMTSIGNSAFYGCSGLTSIAIPNNVASIGNSAFGGCSKLTSFSIPESVTSIGRSTFGGCTGLTSVTIPNSVTSIGDYAFSGCTSLNSITIPENVTSIGYDAFYNCNGLTKAEFANVDSLCGIAFGNISANPLYNAHHLYVNGNEVTELVIPNSVTSIGSYAFGGCSGLTSVTIPNSVTSIGGYAFSGCTGLTSITIPNSVTSIGNGAFQNCSGLTLVTINSNDVVSKSQLAKIFDTQVNTYVLGDGVERIGDSAFSGCSGLSSIEIPNNVTSIGSSAFYGCSGLPSITIPNKVTSIGSSAFQNCSGLTSITIPNNVTSINNYTFYGCTSLSSIAIPENVSSIGDYAFSGCSGLSSIEIPNNVTSIGSSAFYGCSGLPSITIPNKVTSIGSSAFQNCSGLTSVSIPNSVTSIGSSAFYNCTGLTSVTVGNGVASIGDRAFEGCSGIERLDVDCKDIKKNDFGACKANLKEVNIGTNVENIEKDTFKDFTSLQRCSFGSIEGLLNIKFGNAAANPLSITKTLNVDSKVVTELVIPESVTAINDYALYNCNSVKKMIGGGHVTSIGNYAFYNNVKLSSIQIGKNVETIGDYAFNGCPLTSIYNYAEYPQNYNSNVFSIVKENCKLYVLPESVDLYKVHQDWYEFDIQPIIFTFNLTYVVDGEVYKTFTVDSGSTLTAEPNPYKEGYTFSGWSEIPETMPDSDVVVTGSFIVNTYKVTYVVDGDEYKTNSIDYGTALTPEASPTKEGYTFSGWSEIPDTMPANDVEVTGRFYLYGDVNVDSEVDLLDAVDIARFVVGTPSEDFMEVLADLNMDNSVNVIDAVVLVNEIAGDQNFVKAEMSSRRSYDYEACGLELLGSGKNGLSFQLNGEADFTAFQFTMDVPEDMNITALKLDGQRRNGHQLMYNRMEDGSYRVVVLSLTNNVFRGSEGELLSISLDGQPSDDICIRDIHFGTVKGVDIVFGNLIYAGDTDGIESMRDGENEKSRKDIYDLQGRRRSTLQRGVNIVNGRKVIVK